MTRLRWLFSLLLLPSITAEIAPSIDMESIPRPIMPTTCHMLSCMPGMVCRMTEPAVCKTAPCDAQPTCVEGESTEDSGNGDEGILHDPVADKLGEHSTSPEEPVRRNRPLSPLASNWTRGGSAPLLDVDTTKLMQEARDKLLRAVMDQHPSSSSVGEFVVDLICLIRGTCQCNANERYVTCGGCEGTCDNPNPSCSGCRLARCECLPGFVRFSSVCIPSRDCPEEGPRPDGPWPDRPWPGGPRLPGEGPWIPGQPGSRICGRGEEWHQCGDTCEASCDNPNPSPCPSRCNRMGGCRCRSGYVRHWNGRCRPANWCDSTTPTTTTTTWAPNDWLSLESPSFTGRVRDFVVKNEDDYKEEYDRESEEGEMVKREIEDGIEDKNEKEEEEEQSTEIKGEGKVADSVLCPSNEVYKSCVTACEPSCGRINLSLSDRLICALKPCLPTQCACKEGFIRSEADRCVREEECGVEGESTVCPPYQRFMLCGTRCEQTCGQPIPFCPSGCTPPRCECIPGYVRWNNQCVPASSCPTTTTTQATPTCGRNEVFMRCSSPCEPSCYYPNQNCGSQCYAPSCQCAQGYYRRPAPYNDCVSWTQCTYGMRREEKAEECRENEEFKKCTKQCEATCFDRNPKCASSECGPPGCECSKGFLRISVHESVCIPPEMCPAKKTIWRRG